MGPIKDEGNQDGNSTNIIDQTTAENGKVWPIEDSSTSCLYENDHSMEPPQSEPLNIVKQEISEMGPIKDEGNQDENSINIVDQIIDETGKFWPMEDFLTSCNSQPIKTEKIDEFNTVEETKYDINQMIHGNDDSCYTETTAWNLPPIKMERLEYSIEKTEHFTTTKQETEEVFSPEQIDHQMHINSVNSKLKKHKCGLCDYSSSWKSSLNRHMKSIHLKLKNFRCDSCDYSSSINRNLQNHIKSVHLKQRNHKCDSCDYSSTWKSDLQKHIRTIHLKLKNHKCDRCDYSASTNRNLQTHIKSVHLKVRNHKCDLCDYSSSWKSDIQKHVKSVHLNIKDHKCDLCHYSSSTNKYLQLHIKSVHLKLKNHNCNFCDYSSSWKSDLQTHINSIHSKQSNFNCDLCNRSFSCKRSVEKHKKSFHLENDKSQM